MWSGWMSKMLTECFPALRVRQEPKLQQFYLHFLGI